MINIVKAKYNSTKTSTRSDSLGMREMQSIAYAKRREQYILIKSPPASGKSRALMFIALDKLRNQGVKKVIVAVPERSIGGSFGKTDLKKFGFYENWSPNERFNLCSGSNGSTVRTFHKFMKSRKQKILICTHATLRFASETLDKSKFNNVLLAIDEFHHVSADENNRLGVLLSDIMGKSSAHIVAMTGSFFRGDSVPILRAETEAKFAKVTYNYYSQLNGYTYLKTLGIGYHFYRGNYTSAIMDVLDTDKKTILHIPNVNSNESTKEKHKEVDFIINSIGEVVRKDRDTCVIHVRRRADGKIIKVADLVDDSPVERGKIMTYLRGVNHVDDIDLIIALGMAKEGFDWSYCEHALTVGYRGSLTEVVQIIGRAIRDSDNKSHAQFTNLILQPDAKDGVVETSVNNMLKAITSSLLMEQVLAENLRIRRKKRESDVSVDGEVVVDGLSEPSTKAVKDIIEADLNDLKAHILQDDMILKATSGVVHNEVVNRVLIPNIIRVKYPELSSGEVEEVRQHVLIDLVLKGNKVQDIGGRQFIKLANSFVNIDDLSINLIDTINPFQRAYEVISKSVDKDTFRAIQRHFSNVRIEMSKEEAVMLWRDTNGFMETHKRKPSMLSTNLRERRMAEGIAYMMREKRKARAKNQES